MPPRRFTTLVAIAGVALVTLLLLSSSSRQVASVAVNNVPAIVHDKIEKIDLPSVHLSWHKSAHRPPVQKNSTSGDTAWYSDWRWLNPFSSSVTLDENRAVLPPLANRPYVYTYFDTTVEQDKDTQKILGELLHTWKKAWWAQGFRPVVLTQAESMANPLYRGLHNKGMPAVLEQEFMRWLAWDHMGTGLLSNWSCLPMSNYDDPMLAYLRRGEFEKLVRFEGLETGLFAGEKTTINDALKDALDNVKLSSHKKITDAINAQRFMVEQATAVAHYDSATTASKYPKLAKMFEADHAKGLTALNGLITAHLHTVWQNSYSSGIAVLKPLPKHTSKLIEPGHHLAQLLAECPESILQSSCPPNKPKCNPCVGSKMRVATPESFRNISTLFTIATIPHPYTMITLNQESADVTVAHIRRKTDRDTWIRAATRDILGDGRGGPSRVVGLKDAIASEYSRTRGLWFTVEHFPADFNPPPPKAKSPTNDLHPEQEKVAPFPENWLEDLDWHFGFPIPRTTIAHGQSWNPVPGGSNAIQGAPAERKGSYEPKAPDENQAAREVQLLQLSRQTIKSKDKQVNKMRQVAEAWNLADVEIWRFARAFRARDIVERKQWEQEEAAFSEPGSGRAGRWW